MSERYLVPHKSVTFEEIIKKSRFITTLAPAKSVAAAREVLEATKAKYVGASHHCYVWIIGIPGSTSDVKMSDDGEPHGTAGRPMLTVLEGQRVGDVVVVVTRYFGGIKLGRGGLVRAYSGGVKTALERAEVGPLVVVKRLLVQCEYPQLNTLKHFFPNYDVQVESEHFTDRVEFILMVPHHLLRAFIDEAKTRVGGSLIIKELPNP